MAEKNSKNDYLKAAEIMSRLGRGYEKQVLYFLDKAGMCDAEFVEMFKGMPESSSVPGRKKNIDPEFVALLKDLEEFKDPDTYSGWIQHWRRIYGVQQSRIDGWREGRCGISNELKAKIMPEIKEYIDGEKMVREAMKKKAQHPKEPSP